MRFAHHFDTVFSNLGPFFPYFSILQENRDLQKKRKTAYENKHAESHKNASLKKTQNRIKTNPKNK